MDSDQREFATFLADFLGLAENPIVFFTVLIAIAAIAYTAIRLFLIPVLNRLMERTRTQWDDILAGKGVLFWLALLGRQSSSTSVPVMPRSILKSGAGVFWPRSL